MQLLIHVRKRILSALVHQRTDCLCVINTAIRVLGLAIFAVLVQHGDHFGRGHLEGQSARGVSIGQLAGRRRCVVSCVDFHFFRRLVQRFAVRQLARRRRQHIVDAREGYEWRAESQ